MKRLIIAIIILSVVFGNWLSFSEASAAVAVEEMQLNPAGRLLEVQADQTGYLWVSDMDAGEIWRVDPNSSAYRVYTTGDAPSGAAPDNQGGVWWLDVPENGTPSINKLDITTGDSESWTLTGSTNPFGMAFDAENRLWITDSDASTPNIYRFTPTSRELCTFPLPNGGYGNYPTSQGNMIWVGDWNNGRIIRIDTTNNRFDWWVLPTWSAPEAVIVDASENVWFTESAWVRIGKLVPGSSDLTLFNIPSGSLPKMLGINGGMVWYTEQYTGTIGALNPGSAAGATSKPATGWATVNPTVCPILAKPRTGSTNPTPGEQSWTASSLETLVNANGWKIYQLPTESFPWGIAITDGYVWVADGGRQKLVKLAESIAQEPSMGINKSAEQLTYDSVGDVISYTYELTNSGNVTLAGPFTVTDDKAADESCPVTASLAPGAFITCGASYTVTQEDLDAGSVTNTASAHAMFGSSPVASGTDSVTVDAVQSPALAMVKEANPTTYDSVGDEIGYSYTLSNTGNVTLTGPFTVTDDKATVICPVTASLAPGASITCTANYSITTGDITAGSVTNTASGHAMFDGSPVNSSSVEATVTRSVVEYKIFLPLILR